MDAELKVVGALSKLGAGRQDLRGGEFGQALAGVLPAHFELVSRGLVFSGATAATGVAPGTAIGTTGAFTLANPLGSAKKLVVLVSSMGYVSGTLGAGVVWYLATAPAAAAVTGTVIPVSNNYLGGGGSGHVGRAFTTSTLPTTPTILRPAWSLTALLATTAVQPYLVTDHVNGEIMIAPGCALTLHATAAAGSTPIVSFGMTWAELDV
jgi:hypothetical protein